MYRLSFVGKLVLVGVSVNITVYAIFWSFFAGREGIFAVNNLF